MLLRRLSLLALVVSFGWAADKPVDFNRDIRPILSDSCFACHGPDEAKRMVGLRLDTKDGAFAQRKSGNPVVPGNPAKSLIVQRLTHASKALRMPPVAASPALSDAQIALVKRWIAEGAKWDEHWAYNAPVRPTPPEVKRKSWAKNPIDAFVLARLEKEGLSPSKETSKATLIRRVTFDLTGLPPTTAEVDAFLKDKSPGAYEKVVDRLLASPRYGERMTMQWLDLARYADTHGFHIDSARDMWPWRDWVIGAFNRNMRFDEFTVWQLAGDLLPNATRDQKVASGFNRNHMINFEGGAIPEEYQNEYVVDRVDTTSTVWMGLTMGCARCHDHKYDPISQKDFYRFGAFFNTISEKGLDGQKGNAEPFLPLPNAQQEAAMADIKAGLEARHAELDEDFINLLMLKWQERRADAAPESPTDGVTAWYELDGSISDISGNYRHGRLMKGDLFFGNGPVNKALQFDGNTIVRFPAGVLDASKPFTVSFWIRIGRNQGEPVVRMSDASGTLEFSLLKPKTLPRLRRGHSVQLALSDGAGKQLVLKSSGFELLQNTLQHVTVTSDGTGRVEGFQIYLDAKPLPLTAAKNTLAWPLALRAPVEIGDATNGRPFSGTLDDLRFYARDLSFAEVERVAKHFPVEMILTTPGKRSKEQWYALRDYYLTYEAGDELKKSYTDLKRLREAKIELEDQIPTVMVMDMAEKPRDTYVLARGDYTQKTEKVTPGVPAMLPPLPSGQAADRLALAKWLVSPEHPLTARIAVNRYWQMYFGYGIVKTSEDFGSQGEPPVHAELLDWLATEFVRTGWDVKAMQRLIVTSAAYRQQSKVTPVLLEKDPENRLLARGPRYRLPAEMIRDNALAVSGLMTQTIGGKSVLPYQPPGLWEELAFGENFSAQEYEQDHGDKLYRRSMYTFWKRTSPPASLNTFDAPDREKCVARRPVTNTPLQALVTLNDPTYVEASRQLATRVLNSEAKNNDERLREAFRIVTARQPEGKELAVLRNALKTQLATYQHDPQAAEKLLAVGESPMDKTIQKPALAAWTNICTVLLNLDEAITKE